MSLPGFNNKKSKQGNKAQKNSNSQGSKFIPKPGKAAGASKKANRTGGTRGS
jgi:hypothetical protein